MTRLRIFRGWEYLNKQINFILYKLKPPSLVQKIVDIFWPTLWPLRNKGIENSETTYKALSVNNDTNLLKIAIEALRRDASSEDDRGKLVESKLQSLLAFSSVAITLVTVILARAIEMKSSWLHPGAIAIMMALLAYASIQFLFVVMSAIGGLRRRSYQVAIPSSVVPTFEEDEKVYLYRLCTELIGKIAYNREVNNDRVSHMELAHVAVKNAIMALVLAVFLIISLIILYVLNGSFVTYYFC